MIPGVLKRLAGMPAHELRFRLTAAARIHRDRVRIALSGSRWHRSHIGRVLAPDVLGPHGQRAVAQADWQEVARRLLGRIRERPSRFVLDPRDAPAIAATVRTRWPDAPAEAAARADRLLRGRFDLLGYTDLTFARDGGGVDWHVDPVHGRTAPCRFWADVPFLDPRCGDHKIIWELNRQQYLLAFGRAWWLTGERRYRDAIAADIRSWLAANPPLTGINWASMLELALRSLSWTGALHFALATPAGAPDMQDDESWVLDLCIGLDRQLTHVERNLSRYFSPNTHLTGEALGLYVVGTALPELTNSPRWANVGRATLLAEAARQIARDGGHVERSSYYHRYTLDFYTLAWMTAEAAGDGDAAATFRDAVDRLATYMAALTDERGTIPLIGDDDGGCLWPLTTRDPRDVRDALSLAGVMLDRPSLIAEHLPEETMWLGWARRPAVRHMQGGRPEALATPVAVQHFPDTGYAVVKTERADHLVFDVGPHGFLNGGHAHADALAFTLTLLGRPLLVDPGTATYTMDAALRTRLRESAAHNTVTLGGRSLAVPAGPFSWVSRPSARLRSGIVNPSFAVLEGTHDGYAPAQHRRMIIRGAGPGFLVLDTITGYLGELDACWHFDPAWHVTIAGPGRIDATDSTGTHARLLHDGGAAVLVRGEPGGPGWYSPRYGRLQPTFSLRVRHAVEQAATLPTWIGDAGEPVRLETLLLRPDAEIPSAVVRVTAGPATTLTMVGPEAARWRERGAADAGTSVATDARLVQLTTRDTGRVDLSLADVSHVAAPLLPLVELDTDERVRDLHIVMDGEETQVWASTPPARLTLRWGAGEQPATVRCNGREMVQSGGRELVVPSGAWGVPRRPDRPDIRDSAAAVAVPAGARF